MSRASRAVEAGVAADADTLRALEFAAITARLAELTAFGPSRELALATAPVGDSVHVGLLNDQTDEAARLVDGQSQAGIGGARDIRLAIDRASRGGRLTTDEFLAVADTARAAGQFRERLREWRLPQFAALRDDLDPETALRERIERSVDPAGELLDSASAQLASLRKRMRTAQDRVRDRLNAMLRSTELAPAISEPIITIRAGRYVIPVRTEAKGRIKGIVHDQSASGATLFVEPLTVVDLNNAWTTAGLEANAEEERILESLSRDVEAAAPRLSASLAALARADLWIARARLAAELDGVRPSVSPDAAELLSARHPLLGDGVVPIDIRLGDRFGYRAVVVTGPNTGGKTVALKTLGLLVLMHQAGLRVPAADGARLPVFSRVMADIGDEQSIAQSLSTFSGHLRHVIGFLAAAGGESLVLLDEIGAGTDPAEGSALAMAIVDRLLEAGAMVAATTHSAELKMYAEATAGVTNAAVEFDVASLRPTYRLIIGLPGASQAFAIAERLGLPEVVLADARTRLSAEHVNLEETLAALRRRGELQAEALTAASEERTTARAERERAQSGVEQARREAARMLNDARQAADEMLARAEREAAQVERDLARQSRRLPAVAPVTGRARASAARAALAAEPLPEAPSPDDEPSVQPRIGLWARSRTLDRVGRISAVSGRTGRLTLETDGGRLVIPAEDAVVVPEPGAQPVVADASAAELRRQAAAVVNPVLDLRGERVEAALEQLAAYLDQVLLAGLDEVRIIHGAGTGALRRSIRETLAEHPRVRSARSGRREEGGDGTTVVEL